MTAHSNNIITIRHRGRPKTALIFAQWWGSETRRLAGAGFFFLLGGAVTYRQHADRVDREVVDVGVTHVRGFIG